MTSTAKPWKTQGLSIWGERNIFSLFLNILGILGERNIFENWSQCYAGSIDLVNLNLTCNCICQHSDWSWPAVLCRFDGSPLYKSIKSSPYRGRRSVERSDRTHKNVPAFSGHHRVLTFTFYFLPGWHEVLTFTFCFCFRVAKSAHFHFDYFSRVARSADAQGWSLLDPATGRPVK